MRRSVSLLILMAIFTSCSSSVPVQPTPWPTLIQFEAVKVFPENQFLFVVVSNEASCGADCNCPAVEGIMDPFRFKDGTLYLLQVNFDTQETWSETRADQKAIGFYIYQSVSRAQYSFMASFPFESPLSGFVIEGVDKEGAILVRASEQDTILQPGQNLKTEHVQRSGACEMTYSNSLKNFGFIEDSQVVIMPRGEYYP